MFAKDKVTQSMIDAVQKVLNPQPVTEQPVVEEKKDEVLSEASAPIKEPTKTGMRVYGRSYGNSAKAKQDQTKSSVDDLKGPKDKEVKEGWMKKEELKGGQKKIDKNHNNKIDAQDFAILRGQKNEEVELTEEELDVQINEVLSKDATAGDWIHDFVHSDNPKFAGKSKAERKKMALGAYYAKQNESFEDEHGIGKNTDVADKKAKMARLNDTGKKGPLHNVGKGIKAFLKGKPEPMESVEVEGETLEENKNDDAPITTDTLAGRLPGGKMNSFKSFKTRVKPLDKEGDGAVKAAGCGCDAEETSARKSIMAKEEIEAIEEVTIAGTSGWKETKKDVKDKSGAVHTPMSRAKDLARLAFKKVQNDLGKK